MERRPSFVEKMLLYISPRLITCYSESIEESHISNKSQLTTLHQPLIALKFPRSPPTQPSRRGSRSCQLKKVNIKLYRHRFIMHINLPKIYSFFEDALGRPTYIHKYAHFQSRLLKIYLHPGIVSCLPVLYTLWYDVTRADCALPATPAPACGATCSFSRHRTGRYSWWCGQRRRATHDALHAFELGSQLLELLLRHRLGRLRVDEFHEQSLVVGGCVVLGCENGLCGERGAAFGEYGCGGWDGLLRLLTWCATQA